MFWVLVYLFQPIGFPGLFVPAILLAPPLLSNLLTLHEWPQAYSLNHLCFFFSIYTYFLSDLIQFRDFEYHQRYMISSHNDNGQIYLTSSALLSESWTVVICHISNFTGHNLSFILHYTMTSYLSQAPFCAFPFPT